MSSANFNATMQKIHSIIVHFSISVSALSLSLSLPPRYHFYFIFAGDACVCVMCIENQNRNSIEFYNHLRSEWKFQPMESNVSLAHTHGNANFIFMEISSIWFYFIWNIKLNEFTCNGWSLTSEIVSLITANFLYRYSFCTLYNGLSFLFRMKSLLK